MSSRWIWFDFENTPHVLFLEPFIQQLAAEGWNIRITAKPQAQTLELAAGRGMEVTAIGAGELSHPGGKLLRGLARAVALASWAVRRRRPKLLVSSSRTASLAAWLLRVPGVGLLDYEHAEHRTLALGSRSLWFPDLLRHVRLPRRTRNVARFYAGLKENLYLDAWSLDRALERRTLGIAESDFLVVARPPADTAHYAAATSERLWRSAVEGLLSRPTSRLIIVPRNAAQRQDLRGAFAENGRVRILETAVTGPAMLAAADLVIGGGGTMNREAAVLGVPVWSVFTGPSPYIDECLARENRLRWVRSDAEVKAALGAPPRRRQSIRGPYPAGLASILDDIRSRLGVNQESRT
jgi:hypothetical protein